MRVLLIDDEPSSLESLIDELTERGGFTCEICTFSGAVERLDNFRPAAVILDLLHTGPGSTLEVAGSEAFEHIWSARFCPIIVYSAEPGALETEKHPFIRRIQKGGGSEIEAANALDELAPKIDALVKATGEMEIVFHQALKTVALSLLPMDAERLVRAVRRQVAARLDLTRFGETPLAPWEHYIFPPVHSDLMLGDIIRKMEVGWEDASGFRVVLTPSCDLVTSGGRAPKVERVLVARCSSPSALLRALGSQDNTLSRRTRGKLRSILTRGYEEAHLPLPKLDGVLPSMVANLKDLELIPEASLRPGSDSPYVRVASIDSPFREMIVWAYLQVSGRPGLPDRDVESWETEICEAMNGRGSEDESN